MTGVWLVWEGDLLLEVCRTEETARRLAVKFALRGYSRETEAHWLERSYGNVEEGVWVDEGGDWEPSDVSISYRSWV